MNKNAYTGKVHLTRESQLVSLIQRQAQLRPDKVALECGEELITYGELEQLITRYANYLIRQGVTKESLVGIYVNRSAKMIVTLLAILKAGGAYVPMDPSHPMERNCYIIEEAELPIIITEKELVQELPEGSKRLCLEDIWNGLSQELPDFQGEQQDLHQRAYVIFTSGSTGKPKGVEVLQDGMMNYLLCVSEKTELDDTAIGLSVVTITFDISISEMFLPLINGGTLVVADNSMVKDGEQLVKLIQKRKINLMGFTPSTAYMLLDSGWESAQGMTLLIGGEAWNMELAEELLRRGCKQLWNMYGPTETTIYSAMSEIHTNDLRITLGEPLDRTELYVLDEKRKPVKKEQEGELYIGGIGVAKGYLHREDLTKERFIQNPFGEGRLYKTGDLVKKMEDGTIVYLGRMDFQVKIRGYRIELGEIESALQRMESVAQAVVVVRGNDRNAKLCAFVKVKEGEDLNTLEVREHLEKLIPSYMIPNVFTFVSEFPMTPNRKVDRKALMEMMEQEQSHLGYVAPRNEIEETIASLWEELLEVKQVSVLDDFLALGGHSLMANRLLIRMNRAFGTNVSLIELLSNVMTIEQMALTVEENLLSGLSEEELASLMSEV